MTGESASDRQWEWQCVVRRSFGISDQVAHHDARETLIRCFEEQLEVSGWQSAPRGIAEPIVDSLMRPEVVGEVGAPTFTSREGANRLLARGIDVVDPERLVFDASFDYPSEIVAAAQQMLIRVELYVREQQMGT